jgi:2C-methyl-D-erythritol 2,4-cyclodiphosphate synthase
MKKFAIVILSIIALSSLSADPIYEYVDSLGHVFVSNKPPIAAQNKRTQILQDELNRESIALNNTQVLIKQNEQTSGAQQQARRKMLEEALTVHQKNINILKKQLGYSQ